MAVDRKALDAIAKWGRSLCKGVRARGVRKGGKQTDAFAAAAQDIADGKQTA
ncbi:hypothetical protein [Burkholderia stagnalis]|uniref:hypothetical protein n=1 Tax=Burkholderia stagnalis TaxID=1503054 RepID=UPI001639906B|nr:hypothetical protein [Burkholderia stagnalis]